LRWGAGVSTVVLGVSLAHAEQAPVSVWYRNSAGCPDGSTFIARLAELGQSVRLAQVGDRVDFVVTLGQAADASSGRLERQTRAGTVAIREYRDARCEAVAEALALTLDLALDPDEPAPAAPAPAPHASRQPRLPAAADTPTAASSEEPSAVSPSWVIGGQALMMTGIAPGALLGAALFGAVENPDWFVEQVRASVLVARGGGQAAGRELNVSLLAARLEACPLSWGASHVRVAPCAAMDLGAVVAEGRDALAASDGGFWAAATAHGRLRMAVSAALAVEAQLGASAPLVRYEMGPSDESVVWFRTGALGADAAVGLSWTMP
jgi:hypothetical protein